MNAALAALARKHALAPDVVAELEALWSGRALTSPADRSTYVEPGDEGPTAVSAPAAERYEDLGPLGQGGAGEVRRVRDRVLNRIVARKVVLPRLAWRPDLVARFLEEARATAQLQHPNVVPVHDLGQLPDGRVWFTMREVAGRTLTEVIAEVRSASGERWEAGPSGWTLRRLVDAFRAVCLAVAYAHERGVVHRDLKPDNVMVGRLGEVYVLDWGLAKLVGRDDLAGEEGDVVETGRSADLRTRMGQVAGTPAYMPPEQARGEVDRIDARSDVYALGAVLYEILAGRPPYVGTVDEVLSRARDGAPDRLPTAGPPLPAELVAACLRSMARDPADRFSTASELADAVLAWLDGSRRREQALALVDQALAGVSEAEALLARSAATREDARRLLRRVPEWAPEEEKRPAWDRSAEADATEQAARLQQVLVDEGLQAALRIDPELPEAHAALATRWLDRHCQSDEQRDRRATREAEARIAPHLAALPEGHPVRQEVSAYLKGDGALTLVTDPPGAEALLFRHEVRYGRLIPVFDRSLGTTPLRAVAVPHGSWVVRLRRPGHDDVSYPVEIRRRGHWDGAPPGQADPWPIALPPTGWLGHDEVYVPAGWYRVGQGGDIPSFVPRRTWCDAFVMDRFPVTNRQYLAWLHALVDEGRADEALRHAPRERAGTEGAQGPLIYGYQDGRFHLRVDGDGDLWDLDGPVVSIDWYAASAYLAARATTTGRAWRLPMELEWEKAARGVDGRTFPWGDAFDATRCRSLPSARGREHGDHGPVAVDSYPTDTSPYGIRGLAGNVQDWCLDPFDPASQAPDRVPDPDPGPPTRRGIRSVRGGSWNSYARASLAALRYRVDAADGMWTVGFRGLWRPGRMPG